MARKQRKAKNETSRLSRQDWLDAARSALISEGKESVKVERLAKKLGVTRGGFYWHFRDREDLLNALLKNWERETNLAFEQALLGDNANGLSQFCVLVRSWVSEDIYNPRYDSAVRDWARVSKRATRAVKRVDRKRIRIIKNIFGAMGYPEDQAFIRARITYFHQIGYYTLGIGETKMQRRELAPLYIEALTGHEVSQSDVFPKS